jgi:hypothetical protein
LYGAETQTLRKVDQKYLASFEMWYRRRMEMISWTYQVRNEVIHRIKEDRNVLNTTKRRKPNWIGHTLRRNCLRKDVIEGKVHGRLEMIGTRDDLKEKRRYWKLKKETLDRTVWRTCFGRGYGPFVRQTTE